MSKRIIELTTLSRRFLRTSILPSILSPNTEIAKQSQKIRYISSTLPICMNQLSSASNKSTDTSLSSIKSILDSYHQRKVAIQVQMKQSRKDKNAMKQGLSVEQHLITASICLANIASRWRGNVEDEKYLTSNDMCLRLLDDIHQAMSHITTSYINLDPRVYASILHSIGKLQQISSFKFYSHEELPHSTILRKCADMCLDLVYPQIYVLSPKSLAMACWGASRCGVTDSRFYGKIDEQLVKFVRKDTDNKSNNSNNNNMSPSDVAMIATAYASTNVVKQIPDIYRNIMLLSTNALSEYPHSALLSLVWSLSSGSNSVKQRVIELNREHSHNTTDRDIYKGSHDELTRYLHVIADEINIRCGYMLQTKHDDISSLLSKIQEQVDHGISTKVDDTNVDSNNDNTGNSNENIKKTNSSVSKDQDIFSSISKLKSEVIGNNKNNNKQSKEKNITKDTNDDLLLQKEQFIPFSLRMLSTILHSYSVAGIYPKNVLQSIVRVLSSQYGQVMSMDTKYIHLYKDIQNIVNTKDITLNYTTKTIEMVDMESLANIAWSLARAKHIVTDQSVIECWNAIEKQTNKKMDELLKYKEQMVATSNNNRDNMKNNTQGMMIQNKAIDEFEYITQDDAITKMKSVDNLLKKDPSKDVSNSTNTNNQFRIRASHVSTLLWSFSTTAVPVSKDLYKKILTFSASFPSAFTLTSLSNIIWASTQRNIKDEDSFQLLQTYITDITFYHCDIFEKELNYLTEMDKKNSIMKAATSNNTTNQTSTNNIETENNESFMAFCRRIQVIFGSKLSQNPDFGVSIFLSSTNAHVRILKAYYNDVLDGGMSNISIKDNYGKDIVLNSVELQTLKKIKSTSEIFDALRGAEKMDLNIRKLKAAK